MMFHDLLLREYDIDVERERVLVLRHTPRKEERRLRKVFHVIAANEPDLFNAYQATQTPDVEDEMREARYIASFIGRQEPARTVFVGLYEKTGSTELSRDEYREMEVHKRLKMLDAIGFDDDDPRSSIVWFELRPIKSGIDWKGKLLIDWPAKPPRWKLPFKKWDRWAHEWDLPILRKRKDSELGLADPSDEIAEFDPNPFTHWSVPTIPEELSPSETYVEGAARQILVNAYERNPKAREACIKKFRCKCFVCKFDFSETYGQIGEGFIHVHHLIDIATIGSEYQVTTDDLRPVCPNCHAMLHRERPSMAIERLRQIVTQRRNGSGA